MTPRERALLPSLERLMLVAVSIFGGTYIRRPPPALPGPGGTVSSPPVLT